MKRHYTSKRSLCPICGNHHGCAIREDNLIECLRTFSQNDAPPGYRFIKRLRNDMGGLFTEENEGSTFSSAIPEGRRRKRKQDKVKVRELLSIQERDRQFRLVLQWRATSLSKRHFSHLQIERQLKADEIDWLIDRGWVRTWEPDTHAPIGIQPDLPGISPDRKLLGMPGFTIAALDPDGLLTGMQIATLLNDPKYIWLSSNNYGGNGPQLPNGELPLFCWKHPNTEKIQVVILCEGALKSMLVALFLWRQEQYDIAVIGTATAARYGEKTLEDYLKRLDAKDVRLMPDAGAVANPHINQANCQTLEWLRLQGYGVTVADWGQFFDKSQPDFDELLAQSQGNNIRYLSAEDYLAHFQPEDRKPKPLGLISEEEWELTFGLPNFLKRLIKRYRPFRGFGPKPQPQSLSTQLPEVIKYKPGRIPRRSECDEPLPRIIYSKGERLWVWKEAILAGWQHILDSSAPGLGKSHTAGILQPEALGVDQLWYFAQQTRNVTTDTVKKNFAYLQPRHDGLKKDTDPLGITYLRRPKTGESPDTPGNCHRASLFIELYSKNIPKLEGSENPVCATCHLSGACRSSNGASFGHRHLRFLSLQKSRLLAHLDSAPGLEEFDWSNKGSIFDEAMRIINPLKTVEVTLKDVEQAIAAIALKAPDLIILLSPIWQVLQGYLSGQQKLPRYGLGDDTLRQLFAESVNTINLVNTAPEIIRRVKQVLVQDLSFLESPEGVRVTSLPQKWKGIARRASQLLRAQSYQEAALQAKNVLLNWFVPFLEVWSGIVAGSLRLEQGRLIIATRHEQHSAIAKACKWSLYLDATTTRQYLALWLDESPGAILQVEQETPKPTNVEIIHVMGLGLANKHRSSTCERRINALKQHLKQQIPDIIFDDWKDFTQAGDLVKFRDTRGGNYALNAPALASFGVPYQNIGSLELLYTVLTGLPAGKEEAGFREFVDFSTNSEIIQTIGRLRTHIRPNEQLHYYFCADYDLSFLESLGYKVKRLSAFEITPEAGDPTQTSRFLILQGFRQAIERGASPEKVSLKAIASEAGLSTGRVGQVATEFGGVKILRKILAALIEPFKGGLKNRDIADEEIEFLAQTYLPMALESPSPQLLTEILNVANAYGQKQFTAILAALPLLVKARVVGILMQLLPPSFLDEYRVHYQPTSFSALSSTE